MEEEKNGLQTDENTGDTDSQTDKGTPEKSEEQPDKDINWQQRYKDLQADQTRNRQRIVDLEAQLQTPTEESDGEDELGDIDYPDRKTVEKMMDKAVAKAVDIVQRRNANSYFRRTYPNHVKYESAISGILRAPKDPASLKKASFEERIDAAVKEFNEMTAEEKATAKAEAEAEAKKREEDKQKASGLGGPSTPVSKSDEEGESDADYIAKRKARSAKQRGLA